MGTRLLTGNPLMKWPGHALIVGVMGSGKTFDAVKMAEEGNYGPWILYDPSADAPMPGEYVEADWLTGPVAIWEAACRVGRLRYVPQGSATAAAELDEILRVQEGYGPVTVVVDEAQSVAEQGKVSHEFQDAWDRGRHRKLRIITATPVAQLVDHHLRLTASTKVLHKIDYSPWLSDWGVQKGDLDALGEHDAIWFDSSGRRKVWAR